MASAAKEQPPEVNRLHRVVLDALATLPENSICADCGSKAPSWVAVTHGCFVCIECSGIHRSLGTHISKVKSVELDCWLPQEVEALKTTGNAIANKHYEGSLTRQSRFRKPLPRDNAATKREFIIAKYRDHVFVDPDAISRGWLSPRSLRERPPYPMCWIRTIAGDSQENVLYRHVLTGQEVSEMPTDGKDDQNALEEMKREIEAEGISRSVKANDVDMDNVTLSTFQKTTENETAWAEYIHAHTKRTLLRDQELANSLKPRVEALKTHIITSTGSEDAKHIARNQLRELVNGSFAHPRADDGKIPGYSGSDLFTALDAYETLEKLSRPSEEDRVDSTSPLPSSESRASMLPSTTDAEKRATENISFDTLTGEMITAALEIKACIFSAGLPTDVCVSLYSRKRDLIVSGDFIVSLTSAGMPEETNLVGNVRAAFNELTADDLDSDLFFVFNIYSRADIAEADGISTSSSSSSAAAARALSNEKVRDVACVYKRPFGCAVIRLSEIVRSGLARVDGEAYEPSNAAIYQPDDERTFPRFYRTVAQSVVDGSEASLTLVPRAIGIVTGIQLVSEKAAERSARTMLDQILRIPRRLPLQDRFVFSGSLNEFFLTLDHGEFQQGMKKTAKNVSVEVSLLRDSGEKIPRSVARGFGGPFSTSCRSGVTYHCNTPAFGETMRLKINEADLSCTSVLFVIHHASPNKGKYEPCSLAVLPLAAITGAVVPNGPVPLQCYQIPGKRAGLENLQGRAARGDLKTTKESLHISVSLNSHILTQDHAVAGLLRWRDRPDEELAGLLKRFTYTPTSELVKFLPRVLDAMCEIADSPLASGTSEVADALYETLSFVLQNLADEKNRQLASARKTLEEYISSRVKSERLHGLVLERLLASLSAIDDPSRGKSARTAMKSLHYLLMIVLASWRVYAAGHPEEIAARASGRKSSCDDTAHDEGARTQPDASSAGEESCVPPLPLGWTQHETPEGRIYFFHAVTGTSQWGRPQPEPSPPPETATVPSPSNSSTAPDSAAVQGEDDSPYGHFLRQIQELLQYLTALMRRTTPDVIIGSQVLALRAVSRVMDELLAVVSEEVLANTVHDFLRAAPQSPPRLNIERLVLTRALTTSKLWGSNIVRSKLVPLVFEIVRGDSRNTREEAIISAMIAVDVAAAFAAQWRSTAENTTAAGEDPANILLLLADLVSRIENTPANVFLTLQTVFNQKLTRFKLEASLAVATTVLLGQVLDDAAPAVWTSKQEALARSLAILIAAAKGKTVPEWWSHHRVAACRCLLQAAKHSLAVLQCDSEKDGHATTQLWNALLDACRIMALLATAATSSAPELLQEALARGGFPSLDDVVAITASAYRAAPADVLAAAAPAALGVWTELALLSAKHCSVIAHCIVDMLAVIHSLQTSERHSGTAWETATISAVHSAASQLLQARDGHKDAKGLLQHLGEIARGSRAERILPDERVQDIVQEYGDFVHHTWGLLGFLASGEDSDASIEHDRTESLLEVMSFLSGNENTALFLQYASRLRELHLTHENFVEAGKMCEQMLAVAAAARMPYQEQVQLGMRGIDAYNSGMFWEEALALLGKVRQVLYESYAYAEAAQLARMEAEMLEKAHTEERFYSEYFYVAFYGKGFSGRRAILANQRFIYKGTRLQRLSEFVEYIRAAFPDAQIRTTTDEPSADVRNGDGQHIAIAAVRATEHTNHAEGRNLASDRAEEGVPELQRKHAAQSAIATFTLETTFKRSPPGNAAAPEIATVWIRKTHFSVPTAFPCLQRRQPVASTTVVEVSPIELAIATVEQKNAEGRKLTAKATSTNLNSLSMYLSGCIDAAVNGGVKVYRDAFLSHDGGGAAEPDGHGDGHAANLRRALADQVQVLQLGLNKHRELCPPEVLGLQEHLEDSLVKMRRFLRE